jgi:hypothetical protein
VRSGAAKTFWMKALAATIMNREQVAPTRIHRDNYNCTLAAQWPLGYACHVCKRGRRRLMLALGAVVRATADQREEDYPSRPGLVSMVRAAPNWPVLTNLQNWDRPLGKSWRDGC